MIAFLRTLFVLVPVIILIVMVVRWSMDADKAAKNNQFVVKHRRHALRVTLAVLGIVIGAGLAMAIVQINTGQRGVVLRFGATTNRTLDQGLHIVTPFINSVTKMDLQIQAYKTKAGAASKDLQDVATDVTLNYQLDPALVISTYRDFRNDYVRRIIEPSVQEAIKASTARYDAEELITKRPDVKAVAENALTARLGAHGIRLVALSITNFEFSKTFTDAIEAKVVAVQSALQAQNKLQQVQFEAQQAAAVAKGQADAAINKATGDKQAAITNAEGQAQALLVVADAQAKANQLVNASLTDDVIRYALVQKLGQDIKVVVLPAGQNFILGDQVLSPANQPVATPAPTAKPIPAK